MSPSEQQIVYLALGVVVAVVLIVFIRTFRRHARVKVEGPGGSRLELDGSNEQTKASPGVLIKDAVSTTGGITANDHTNRGAVLIGVKADKDINVSSSGPTEKGKSAPKS
jgi:hypothetical protein